MSNSFGNNLKQERINAGYTQKEFAKKLGITQQRVSQWECGKVEPTLGSLISILRTLNVRLEDLIDYSDANEK